MRSRLNVSRTLLILGLSLSSLMLMGTGSPSCVMPGLDVNAKLELKDAGVDKYLGEFHAVESEFGVWTKHTFDPQYDQTGTPNGPVCIAGTEYSVFTKEGDPNKVLIFLQGGGACWQNFYNCNVQADDQAPGEQGPFPGVFDSDNPDNPYADYSVVYMPYCDGSAFGGDNDVDDPTWQAFIEGQLGLPPGSGPSTRFHRGVRNVSAGMDVAADTFPHARRITVMGHSAGGVGVAAFAPFLARFVYGNSVKLTVFNDAGPIAVNLGTPAPPPDFCADLSCFSVLARANDWQFAQFYPQSCIDDGRCNPFGQQTGIIDWRLENDSTIREAFYETDADQTNRFFAQGDGTLMDPLVYRDLILTEHGALHDAYPNRYKRFIVSADNTHGAVQGAAGTSNEQTGLACFPAQPFLFYTQDANGVFLSDWTTDFVSPGAGSLWDDIVEDYVAVSCP